MSFAENGLDIGDEKQKNETSEEHNYSEEYETLFRFVSVIRYLSCDYFCRPSICDAIFNYISVCILQNVLMQMAVLLQV